MLENESVKTAIPEPPLPLKKNFRKTILFTFLASILTPLIVFLAMETGMRSTGYGYRTSFFLKQEIAQRSVYVNNPEYELRFCPKFLLRKSNPFVMPLTKEKNTIRIFILGSSAALGDPNPSFGFGRILEKMLHARYPQIRFEIINTAMTAINSHAVLPIASECLTKQPDLFVLYMGNNEVAGPFGAGSVVTPYASNLFFIRAQLSLLNWKVGQWIQNLTDRPDSNAAQPQQGKDMEVFSEKNYVRFDDPRLQNVYSHFQSNLDAIVSECVKAGVPLLICTLGTNLKDFPPLASLHDPQLSGDRLNTWNALYQKGIEAENEKRFSDATDFFLHAETIDARYAELNYRLGRCALQQENYQAAKEYFLRARDMDAFRFRADTEINRILRTSASNRETTRIYSVDVENILEASSENQIPGGDLFYKHVYLTFHGNYLVARSLLDAIESALPESSLPEPRADILTERDAKERLAYTLWDRYQSLKAIVLQTSAYPFTEQIDHAEHLQQMKAETGAMEKIMTFHLIHQHKSQYQKALDESPSDWQLHYNFGRLLMAAKFQIEAVTQFTIVTQSIPHHPEAFFDLGVAYLESGDYKNAIEYFQQTLTMQPDYIDADYNIAISLSKLDKNDEALQKYQQIVQRDPVYENAYYQMGSIRFQKQEWDLAEQDFAKVVELNPQSNDALISIGLIQGKRGDFQKALEWFEKAQTNNPDDPTIQRYVRAAQQKLK